MVSMISNNFEWDKTKQFSAIQLLLAFAIPSIFAYIGFRIVLPILVGNGIPILFAWPSVASVMLLILVTAAIIFLKSEAKHLNISLVSRMCLKKISLKQWLGSLVILVVGIIMAALAANLVQPFINLTGLEIPNYMPFFLNPSINPMETDSSIISPGFPIKGQVILLPLMATTLVLNILAEELYFRSWILPKLSKYGNTSWVINGTLFAFYHIFQFWLFPTILIGSLIWAFVIYKTKSIWPALAGHFVGNFLFGMMGVLMLILG